VLAAAKQQQQVRMLRYLVCWGSVLLTSAGASVVVHVFPCNMCVGHGIHSVPVTALTTNTTLHGLVFLSLISAMQDNAKPKLAPVLTAADLHPGLKVVGWVCGISKDALWLSLAPELKGRVHLLESAENPEALAAGFEQRFSIGQGVVAAVLGIDAKQHTLDLSLRADRLRRAVTDPAAAAAAGPAAAATDVPAGGALVPGRIVSVAGSGVVVQLGPKTLGVVSLTDIHDTWVPNALAGFSAGIYVRARVLVAGGAKPRGGGGSAAAAAVDSKGRLLLSLRPSEGGLLAAEEGSAEAAALAAAAAANKKQQQAAAAAADGLLQAGQLKARNKVCIGVLHVALRVLCCWYPVGHSIPV
jgi:predicted RNA-binding protein with RPS1 domain